MGMTIALILAVMAVPSLGNTLNMPGGTSSVTGISATATGNTVTAFDFDANNIQADILAIATTTGIGSVTTNAHGNVGSVATGSFATLGAPAPQGLVVTAKGNVDVNVKGTNAAAKVTSVAQIHSKASLLPAGAGVSGEAWIYSGIGKTWDLGAPNTILQKGSLSGAPEGEFEADSTAEGAATYSAELKTSLQPVPNVPDTTQTLSVSGSVDGKTTLAAEVAYANGKIGGSIVGLDATGPAYAETSSESRAEGTVDAATQKLTTGTMSAENHNHIHIASTNTRDLCAEDPLGAMDWVSGTATGTAGKNKAEGKSRYYKCDPSTGECDIETFAANTEKADSMSADVRTFLAGDMASANAELHPTASVTKLLAGAVTSTAGNLVSNTGTALRTLSGDQAKMDAGSEERVYGKAYFGTGSWKADASHQTYHRNSILILVDPFKETTTTSKASVSGNLDQVTINGGEQPNGMNAAAYLLFKKTDGAIATISNTQSAQAIEAGALTTSVSNSGHLQGPRAKSLGGVSSWDGVGFYASFKNVNVNAADEYVAIPKAISTSVPDTQSYMWTDGTNDLMYNGPGFIVNPYPTITPIGSGLFNGVLFTYTPSLTQRDTLVTANTHQP
jgi:hypothetical protein